MGPSLNYSWRELCCHSYEPMLNMLTVFLHCSIYKQKQIAENLIHIWSQDDGVLAFMDTNDRQSSLEAEFSPDCQWLDLACRMTLSNNDALSTKTQWDKSSGAVWDHDEEFFLFQFARSAGSHSERSYHWHLPEAEPLKALGEKQNCVLFSHELSMKPSVLWVCWCQVAFIYWICTERLNCALRFYWLFTQHFTNHFFLTC